jgi:hypothetical protein
MSTSSSAPTSPLKEDITPFRTPHGDNSIQEYGSEGQASDLEAAALTLHNYLDARARQDWALACSQLSSSVRTQLAELAPQSTNNPRSCAAALATLSGAAPAGAARPEARAADVASLRDRGDRGFLLFRGTEAKVYAIPVQREGSRWTLGGVAATPLGP